MSFEPINIEDTRAVQDLRRLNDEMKGQLFMDQELILRLRESNAELLAALKEWNGLWMGSENIDDFDAAYERLRAVIARAEKLK